MTSVSIDNMIAKVIRDTRIPDSSYLADMYEWIPEAMRMLKTLIEAPVISVPVNIVNHQGKLPCGLIDLLAVEYQGARLRYYNGIRPGGSIPQFMSLDNTGFTAYPTYADMPSGPVLDLQYVQAMATHPTAGYQIHLDQISTTFATGVVTIYLRQTPIDAKGLPLIPDHADYKEALYWWTRSKLIQSGYKDPVYNNDDRVPMERWELYAARAISDITYPSVDQKEAQLAMSVRFIPPSDYYDSFFNSDLPEPFMDTDTGTTTQGFSSPIGPLINSQEN